ncbi:hypothetical protein QC762_0083460 [Podospora pseudocomata]|uniref:Uncharacterized protein n=1 Tax=Podospora pseudocomata TaxID=2093779 RepID=A0ABR0GCE2_9PEZI|nr:hypothetical protein QC762_0083460 [Podospora pseudocomata]
MGHITDASGVSFTNPLKRTPSAEQAVMTYARNDSRPITFGLVKGTPAWKGDETWHTGGTDPNAPEHLTVELKDSNGNHITTKHIDRNGNAC